MSPNASEEIVRVVPLLSAKGFTIAGTQLHQSRRITSRSRWKHEALLAGCRCFMQHGTIGLSVSRYPPKGCSGYRCNKRQKQKTRLSGRVRLRELLLD